VSRTLPSSVRNVVLLTMVALLPVGLLAASSIELASNQVTSDVNKQVQTTAAVSAVVIGQTTTNLLELVKSYATRPSLVAGVTAGAKGNAAVEVNLMGLAQAVPGISATFIASLGGTSLATYPLEPTVIGKNFAYRNWYKGLIASGRPYVSDAIVTKEADHPLAVTITGYIVGPSGRPVGILGANYLLQSIASYSANVGRVQGITLTVTDRLGTSLTAGGAHGLVSLAGDPAVRDALAGKSGLLHYAPILAGGGRGPLSLSAYTPVVGTGWTVIASVPESIAFAGLARLRDTVLAIAAALVIILSVGVRAMVISDRRRRRSELEVQSRDRVLARVLESTDEGFVSTDGLGEITAWNGRAEDLYGWEVPEVLGRNFADTVVPAHHRDAYKGDLAAYRAGYDSNLVGKRVETTALHHDGHEIAVEMGVWAHEEGDGFSSFVHDITERVKGRARLSLQARTDQLTGLANRFALLEALNATFGRDAADMLMFVDLDRFKIVNDSLGHEAGDAVIAETGRRLCRVNGADDFVSRLGGDEFALILRGPLTATEGMARCTEVLEAIRLPYELAVDGVIMRSYLGASIGLTFLSGQSAPAAALREADLALYAAKGAGRDRFMVFDESLRYETLGRMNVEAIISEALESGSFVPYLQPIVRVSDNVTLGHEMTLRLEQSDGEDDLPSDFRDVAEESGLVTEVDKLTIRAAVQLLTDESNLPGMVDIKLSARTIRHPGFGETVAEVVQAAAGTAFNRLGVEIPEQLLVEDEQIATAAIDLLHAAGFRVGLDRFGVSGYPLARLCRQRLDFVKIDRAFIASMATDNDAAEDVLRLLIDIGTAFDFEVIAEGVDTPRHVQRLIRLGCHCGQGEILGSARSSGAHVSVDPRTTDVNGSKELASALVSGSNRRARVSGRGLLS
jgi:diguanylate cyclase (GGDEF)-like protein/PAS domain S-box-containing protein